MTVMVVHIQPIHVIVKRERKCSKCENITKGSAYFVDPDVINKSLGNPQGAGFNT